MELRVFQKDKVSFTEMLAFLVKYLVLFDTTSLYTGKQVLAKLEDGDLYDACFNSSSKAPQKKSIVLLGGADSKDKKPNEKPSPTPTPPKGNDGGGAEGGEGELNQNSEEEEKPKRNKPGTKLLDNRVAVEDKGFDFKSELLDLLNEGAKIIKNGLAYVMSFIAFASIYPAIPFFVVLATLYGLLNWIFNKIKFL